MQRTEVQITSHGEALSAWCYRLASVDEAEAPVIVMAHGLGLTKRSGLAPYAERFADAGYVVVVFDYRYWGDSTGLPRNLISTRRRVQDFHAVIAWARAQRFADPDRVVAWGTSFGGGHVLSVGAADHRLAGVISQVPFLDGLDQVKRMPAGLVARYSVLGVRDYLRHWTGRPPVMEALVGPEGSRSAFPSTEVLEGYRRLTADEPHWTNAMCARLGLHIAAYRPVKEAQAITCPLLVLVVDQDSMVPPHSAANLADPARHRAVRTYHGRHFEPYDGPLFEEFVGDQLAFLARHVPTRANVSSGIEVRA